MKKSPTSNNFNGKDGTDPLMNSNNGIQQLAASVVLYTCILKKVNQFAEHFPFHTDLNAVFRLATVTPGDRFLTV